MQKYKATFASIVIIIAMLICISVSQAQTDTIGQTDKVHLRDGSVHVGKVKVIKTDIVEFIEQRTNLTYEFKKSEIRSIVLSSGESLTFSDEPAMTEDSTMQKKPTRLRLSGPRVGFSLITGDDADELKKKANAGPFISLFGWQAEQQFFSPKEGLAGLSEWIFLVGGVEQATFLPSISWLIGIRTGDGTEFAVGPNLSVTGTALVLSAGITKQTTSLNFPIDFGLILAKGGPRFALLVGFNSRE